ncbi:uncharacterized protein C8Q71DRAFT_898006 [Rhodofomes roseus]|uniref:Uncharacterized protein n=1 Tax=Rhodofomes roseus TaxID=34475 RepID=A0ABQ8KJH0_9APHY|nr:uncharacterized protein C8Q71DRAFT_898006 [Rhodofomes roseus]KAH9837654.1 hypothetical protein C8Q71DRAFT_898006 [Rhodofomes roseus]
MSLHISALNPELTLIPVSDSHFISSSLFPDGMPNTDSDKDSLLDIDNSNDQDVPTSSTSPESSNADIGQLATGRSPDEGDDDRHTPGVGRSESDGSPAAVAGTKRRAEGDLAQCADMLARHFKLPKSQHNELVEVASMSNREHMLYNSAQMAVVQDMLTQIQPAQAQWKIPDTLWRKIDLYSYAIIVSPNLDFYLGEGEVTQRLLAHAYIIEVGGKRTRKVNARDGDEDVEVEGKSLKHTKLCRGLLVEKDYVHLDRLCKTSVSVKVYEAQVGAAFSEIRRAKEAHRELLDDEDEEIVQKVVRDAVADPDVAAEAEALRRSPRGRIVMDDLEEILDVF